MQFPNVMHFTFLQITQWLQTQKSSITSALPAKVPVIAGEQGICKGCGIATLSISYYDIGYKAGEMAYDILVNGADITTMKIEDCPDM